MKKQGALNSAVECRPDALISFNSLNNLTRLYETAIPKPNGLACIYYASELDSMVEEFEARVKAHSP